MNLDEVVGEVPECNGGDMVLNLFREGVSQASEPPYRHPNRQVVSLDIASVDVLWVGHPGNGVTLATKTYSGAVALLSVIGDTVDLDQHRIVHVARKRPNRPLYGKLQAVTGKLDAIGKTARKVFNKIAGAFGTAFADEPAWYQLGIRVNRGPEPCIACAGILRRDIGRHVLLLGIAKRPALINLHPFALEVLKHAVLVVGTKGTNLEDESHNGLFGYAGYADGGADGVAFNQATDDLGALFGSEAVHASIMHYRLRSVKTFADLFSGYFQGGKSYESYTERKHSSANPRLYCDHGRRKEAVCRTCGAIDLPQWSRYRYSGLWLFSAFDRASSKGVPSGTTQYFPNRLTNSLTALWPLTVTVRFGKSIRRAVESVIWSTILTCSRFTNSSPSSASKYMNVGTWYSMCLFPVQDALALLDRKSVV